MILHNPVRGTVHPSGWTRPTGNLDFKLTQRFGCTGVAAEPPLGSCAHFHRGIDLGNARCGDAVLAAGSGIVYRARRLADGNLYVIIDHSGGTFTIYGHLSSKIVSEGMTVVAGAKIGTVGESGNASACHLHFGYKTDASRAASIFSDTNGTWRDPWPQLAQNVTIRPDGPGDFLRTSEGAGTVLGPAYAQTKDDGHIRRLSDNADLGLTTTMRAWGGTVIGASYTAKGVSSRQWDRIFVGGAYRYIAAVLAVKSAS